MRLWLNANAFICDASGASVICVFDHKTCVSLQHTNLILLKTPVQLLNAVKLWNEVYYSLLLRQNEVRNCSSTPLFNWLPIGTTKPQTHAENMIQRPSLCTNISCTFVEQLKLMSGASMHFSMCVFDVKATEQHQTTAAWIRSNNCIRFELKKPKTYTYYKSELNWMAIILPQHSICQEYSKSWRNTICLMNYVERTIDCLFRDFWSRQWHYHSYC